MIPSRRAQLLATPRPAVYVDPVPGYVAAIVAAYSSAPDTTHSNAISAFVTSLYNAGVWSKLDQLWVFAGSEDQGSRVNWKAPGTSNMAKAGSTATPTFTTDQGWTSAANSYLDSGYQFSTGGGQHTRNDNHFSVATLTDANDTAGAYLGGGTGVFIQPRNNAGNLATTDSSGSINSATANTGKGQYGVNRTASTGYDRYKNGSFIDTITQSSVALPAANLLGLTKDGTTLSNKKVSLISSGGSLNSTQWSAFWTAYSTYMTAIGQSAT